VPLGELNVAIQQVNDFLKTQPELKSRLVEYWEERYSQRAVAEKWYMEIEALTS
jgi:hypothetical protein